MNVTGENYHLVEQTMARIGVDMVEIAQLARLVEKSATFTRRTFSPKELGAAAQMTDTRRKEYLAGRFAAKEAALKALGVGLTRDFRLAEIETTSLSSGAPRLAFHGKASEFAQQHGVYQFYISISHERQFAVAFVVLLSDVSQQLIDCLRIRGIER
ncbi:MAG: holo-[acyl-carrier-protein] synthase [Chloroflexi bacterium]|nr:MAG: holo-[acyl-carrier-protein] synthase [Acidobacteriota bacterium]TMF41950.1 MAG: holo-[acyl-carrier-protein] synthase [Chloroflexota bacterium]